MLFLEMLFGTRKEHDKGHQCLTDPEGQDRPRWASGEGMGLGEGGEGLARALPSSLGETQNSKQAVGTQLPCVPPEEGLGTMGRHWGKVKGAGYETLHQGLSCTS